MLCKLLCNKPVFSKLIVFLFGFALVYPRTLCLVLDIGS